MLSKAEFYKRFEKQLQIDYKSYCEKIQKPRKPLPFNKWKINQYESYKIIQEEHLHNDIFISNSDISEWGNEY